MSAWDAGEEAGKEWRRKGGSISTLDVTATRAQAEAYGRSCHYRPRQMVEEYTTEWLYGFYKAALEEAADDEV